MLTTTAMNKEETNSIWREFKRTGSEELRNRLIERYLPLVKYTAERLKGKLPENVDVQDLISAGILGLMDAVGKFDLERGIRFETYCSLRIRGAILDDLRAGDWVPRLVRNKAQQLDKAIQDLRVELNREPLDEEVADHLALSLGEYLTLRKEVEVRLQVSLEPHPGEASEHREMKRLEMLADRHNDEPYHVAERKEIRELAVKGLSEKEKLVIVLYYFENMTMKEIGVVLDLSESRVCQIHAQTLELLRQKFAFLAERGFSSG